MRRRLHRIGRRIGGGFLNACNKDDTIEESNAGANTLLICKDARVDSGFADKQENQVGGNRLKDMGPTVPPQNYQDDIGLGN